ncbi:MAG: hypothetical protein H7Z16_18255 [Pyrinomonadaceae bacterium]|nr:hypothetical protein [Pyrinomonadaceae bacterium]
MKKRFLKSMTMLLAIVALAFITAVASNAQSASKSARQLVADIPFEFSIDYKTMPAGEYVVQTVATAGDGLLIQSADGKNSALRPSEATERLQKNVAARLVFHRYGQRYFLAEVWNGADKAGRQLMKSRDELAIERELANISSKSELAQSCYETVEVLAKQTLAMIR